jgi:hypothetical protein
LTTFAVPMPEAVKQQLHLFQRSHCTLKGICDLPHCVLPILTLQGFSQNAVPLVQGAPSGQARSLCTHLSCLPQGCLPQDLSLPC